tara:strand:+ start:5569 stop:6087 length:519 start_codon:yes stop_codon:yes gene_type:complete
LKVLRSRSSKVQHRSQPNHCRLPLRLFQRSQRKFHNPLVPLTHHQPETVNEATDQLARIQFPTPVEMEIEELPTWTKPLLRLALSLKQDAPDADRDRIDRHRAVRHNATLDNATLDNATLDDGTADSAMMDDGTAGSGRNSESASAPAACRFFEEIQELVPALAAHPATTTA